MTEWLKRHRTVAFAMLFIALVAVIFVLRPRAPTIPPSQYSPTTFASAPRPAPLPAPTVRSDVAPPPHETLAALSEEGKIPAEAIARFLSEQGRTSDNLTLAFLFNRDLSYIDEALALDPHNINALYARLAVPPFPEDSQYVDTLRSLEPDNPLWRVVAAYYSFLSNDQSSVLELLRTADTLGTMHDPHQFLLSAEESFRRDYLSASPLEAVTDSRFAAAFTLGTFFNKLGNYLIQEMAAASSANDPSKASSLLAAGLTLTQVRAQRSCFHDYLRAVRAENHLLTLVDRLAIPPPSFDRPLADCKEAAQADAALAERLKSTRSTFLASASPEALAAFLHNRSELGEAAALRLLLD